MTVSVCVCVEWGPSNTKVEGGVVTVVASWQEVSESVYSTQVLDGHSGMCELDSLHRADIERIPGSAIIKYAGLH